jgi:hypothetical protein
MKYRNKTNHSEVVDGFKPGDKDIPQRGVASGDVLVKDGFVVVVGLDGSKPGFGHQATYREDRFLVDWEPIPGATSKL